MLVVHSRDKKKLLFRFAHIVKNSTKIMENHPFFTFLEKHSQTYLTYTFIFSIRLIIYFAPVGICGRKESTISIVDTSFTAL